MSEGSGIERRLHPRYELMAQVRVKRGTVDYVMEMVNISRGGALFSMGTLKRPPWVEASRVTEISIVHPVELDAIEVKGEIVRVTSSPKDTLVAVRFVELTAGVQAQVDRLVELAAETAPPAKGPPPLPK